MTFCYLFFQRLLDAAMCLPALRLLASGLGQNLFALSDLCLKEDEGAEEDMYIYIYRERERERESACVSSFHAQLLLSSIQQSHSKLVQTEQNLIYLSSSTTTAAITCFSLATRCLRLISSVSCCCSPELSQRQAMTNWAGSKPSERAASNEERDRYINMYTQRALRPNEKHTHAQN